MFRKNIVKFDQADQHICWRLQKFKIHFSQDVLSELITVSTFLDNIYYLAS